MCPSIEVGQSKLIMDSEIQRYHRQLPEVGNLKSVVCRISFRLGKNEFVVIEGAVDSNLPSLSLVAALSLGLATRVLRGGAAEPDVFQQEDETEGTCSPSRRGTPQRASC